MGESHAGVQPEPVHQVPRQAAGVRRLRRFDLPSLRPGQPPPHGVRARARRLRRRAGAGDPAGVQRDLPAVLQPRSRCCQAKVRLRAPSVEMRALLEESFRAAVAAADPRAILAARLPPPPKGRTYVAAAGKAAAAMALAVERHFPSDVEGIAITRYGHGVPTKRIRVVEAGHPVPDEAGEVAAREILAAVRKLGPEDLLLALLSGGGSSLRSLPAPDVAMAGLKKVTAQLLKSGAAIQEINTVRKHLSAIHGGRLAAASRAPVVALIISDVTGDDPTHIASRTCAPDPTTYADAREILARYGIEPPASVKARLQKAADETPKPGDPVFAKVQNKVIATAHRSLEAAAEVFAKAGVQPVILGDTVTGEAAEVAKVMAALVYEIRKYQKPWKPPVALRSGRECTRTIHAQAGRGGGAGGGPRSPPSADRPRMGE